MSCAIEVKPILRIDDNERGLYEYEEGDDIHLVLTDGETVFGELQQIRFGEITVVLEDDEEEMIINFEEIEGWL